MAKINESVPLVKALTSLKDNEDKPIPLNEDMVNQTTGCYTRIGWSPDFSRD